MLKPAVLYKDALPACWAKASLDPRNRFYAETYWNFENTVRESNWESHQFVSVDSSDNIVGYISITIDRGCHFVRSLGVLRFDKSGKYDILFARDFKEFFRLMFCYYKYQKMSFSVCIGSPHEKMYDRFCRKYGGRIVGIKKRNFRLMDGTICDQKIYELLIEDFLKKAGDKLNGKD